VKADRFPGEQQPSPVCAEVLKRCEKRKRPAGWLAADTKVVDCFLATSR